MKFILTLSVGLVLMPLTIYSQNDFFPELIKFKTETEQNAQYVIKYWDSNAPEYSKALRLYNATYGSFEGWIEFCRQEAIKSSKSKKYKFDTERAKQMIVLSIDDANAFNKYIDDSDAVARLNSRGDAVVAIAVLSKGLEAAELILDFITGRKEKRRMIELEQIERELSRLRLIPWTSFEERRN